MRLLKRKSRKLEGGYGKLELEKVFGLTTASANALSCNVVTGDLAYLAGCVVVVYNVKANCQTRFLVAPKSSKAFSCTGYSCQGGRFLAAGELGHQPGIIIWEIATGSCVGELRTHKYGVCSVQFSPNGKHLVSIGVPHDGHLCLWDWKSGTLLAKARASTASLPACAMQFASDGSFFVTGGAKHLKHWMIGVPKARSAGGNGTIGLEGKAVKLGSQIDSLFVSILSAPSPKEPTAATPDYQPLYALTAGGVLCLLHRGLAIEKWVDLKVRQGFALAVSEAHVGCACSDGIIRIFMHSSLAYAVTLPRPAAYGYHGLTDLNLSSMLALGNHIQPGIRFPDAVACSFLQEGQMLAVIYGDHSLFVWDVRSFSKIGRNRTFLSHSSCIWDVSILPRPQRVPAPHLISDKDCVPGGAFATGSADGTIRLWYLGSEQEGFNPGMNSTPSPTPQSTNVYSKDILGVLYIDNRGERKERPFGGTTHEDILDSSHGFRSICASPDGQHLAAGDWSGNLRIYDLHSLQLISFQEAHEGEILSLSFTTNTNGRLVEEPVCMPLLASGGTDRLVHIYDVNRDYHVVETLDDHSASVTTVKFACSGSKLLSCSADKSVVFRNVVASSSACKSTRYHQEMAPRGTIYDIDTEPSEKLAVAVGQDKKVNILNLSTGKTIQYFKPEGDVGEPLKVRMDPSGMYVVCSHSDKCMRVYDFSNGELIAQASGHAEVITGVAFLPDCRRLISVSGDSCIFIWRLPLYMSRSMRKRCIAKAESRPPPKCLKLVLPQLPEKMVGISVTPRSVDHIIPFDLPDGKGNNDYIGDSDETSNVKVQGYAASELLELESIHEEAGLPEQGLGELRKEGETAAGFRFSVSRLPPWAQDAFIPDKKSESKGDESALQSFESQQAENETYFAIATLK